MPRVRLLAYALVAAGILVFALLGSGVVASPIDSAGAASLWKEGPAATIPPNFNLTITLQRPNSPPPSAPWAVPVTLTFWTPGADPSAVPPLYTFSVTLDNTGKWSGPLDLPLGTYDVRVRNLHTLRNVKENVIVAASNNLDMGTLLEGDADADNKVRSSDFTILRNAYFSNEGGPNWDPRADFDEDNKIRSSDFALLSLNYFKTGDIEVMAPLSAGKATAEGALAEQQPGARRSGPRAGLDGLVALALTPRVNRAARGEIVTLTLTALAGDQPFTAADARITFAPDTLQVVDAAGNPAERVEILEPFVELINKVDNQAGAILLGGGKFGDAVSGDVPLATLRFKVLKPAAADVKLVDCTVADPTGKFVTGDLYDARVIPPGYTSICLPIVSTAP